MSNYNVECIEGNYDALGIYNLILEKRISKAPEGFWKNLTVKETLDILKSFLYNCVGWDGRKDFEIEAEVFKDKRLEDLRKLSCKSNLFYLVDRIFPGKFKIWELGRLPFGYWDNKENAREATRWLIDKVASTEKKLRITCRTFKKYDLISMLSKVYEYSPYQAINDAYPGKYMPWEITEAPTGYWDDEQNCILAIRWLIQKVNEDSQKTLLKRDDFIKYYLWGMLSTTYKGNTTIALSAAA